MLIKGCNEEDFTNYKKPSMFIIFPFCDFKCDKENGTQLCQNWSLSNQKAIDISIDTLIDHYISNPITHAIVCGGLEPFKSFQDLFNLLKELRTTSNDDFVIYTGYYPQEIEDELIKLSQFSNVIVKFGRFKPNQQPHFDEILGITLANDEQFAKKIS